MNLNDKIANQKRGGKGDTLPDYSYYSNSYVERLKALGSDVQYSNVTQGGVTNMPFTSSGIISLNSVFINKESTISSISWRQQTTGSYTPNNYNGIGIYSVNSNTGILTLLGSTTNDGTIWSTVTASNFGNKSFISPITLQSGMYYIALLYNNSAQVTGPILSRSSITSMDATSKFNYTFLSNNLMLSTKTLSTYTTLPATLLSTDFDIGELSDFLYWLH